MGNKFDIDKKGDETVPRTAVLSLNDSTVCHCQRRNDKISETAIVTHEMCGCFLLILLIL